MMRSKKTLFIVLVIISMAVSADEQRISSAWGVKPIRAFHFIMAPAGWKSKTIALAAAKNLVVKARDAKFNTIIIQISNSFPSDSAPDLVRPGAWDKAQWVEFIKYARKNDIEVIPEVKLLTQQKKFFKGKRRELMFNRATYDPRKSDVYSIVQTYLDEIIDLFSPIAIHIGHDEVAGFSPYTTRKYLAKGEKILPTELFLKDIEKIHSHLKLRGVQTWMWGDMLISPKEFPQMKKGNLHGRTAGYGKQLRERIPNDIVICDWHYSDKQAIFPSLKAFSEEGFRVLGATWRNDETTRNFSRYAASHGADGMIATTWFYVLRKEWDVVDRIINVSGEAFSQDFPDAK